MTDIDLDRRAINRALPKVCRGLHTYVWLQAKLRDRDVSRDGEYQTRFVGFYRVRRNATWRRAFFETLERAKDLQPDFAEVLRSLHRRTRRVEASFASKLAATIDPSQPVIDSIVLANVGLRLPPRGDVVQRLGKIVELHEQLRRSFAAYLKTGDGQYLVKQFRHAYPSIQRKPDQLTDVKMLDLVLWQTR